MINQFSFSWLASAAVLVACGGSPPSFEPGMLVEESRIAPESELETRILEASAAAPENTPTTIDGVVVTVLSAYDAASGRRCRELLIDETAADRSYTRLICRFGDKWGYTPDIGGS